MPVLWQRIRDWSALEDELRQLKRRNSELQKEQLALSQLVHDYETQIHNLERRAIQAEKARKDLERGFVGIARENKWMKDELLWMKQQKNKDTQ